MATSTFMNQGWSAQLSSSSPWNAGILLDVPAVMNQYPPGLGYGAWRAASSSRSSIWSTDHGVPTGSKRSRPPFIRSNRRAPPPPSPSRLQPVPSAFPSEDPFGDGASFQDENKSSNLIIYKSPNHSRTRLASQSQIQSSAQSYNMHHFESVDRLARQRAAADKEARLKVIASILLNRVNVVGKPMRRRPRAAGDDGQTTYVRSGLGRCVSVAE